MTLNQRIIKLIFISITIYYVHGRPQKEDKTYDGDDSESDEAYDCTDSCHGLADGKYQSCLGCHVYVTCTGGNMTDSRPCPPGFEFDNNKKTCEMISETCKSETEETMFMNMEPAKDMPNGSNPEDMPKSILLNFNIKQKPVTLNLTKNNHIPYNFPMFTGPADNIRQINYEGDEFGLYNDPNMKASIIVKRNMKAADDEDMHEYRGVFHMDDEDYYVQPSPEDHASRKKREAQGGGTYMCRKMRAAMTDFELELGSIKPEIAAMEAIERAALERAEQDGSLPTGVQTHFVEVLLFLDYGVYDNWFRLSSKPTNRERDLEALENIRYYYSHVMNGVDLRYASINDRYFQIYVKLNAIYIARKGEESPWTEYNRNGYYTEAYDSLDDFELWLNQSRFSLPPFDQATLFTGYFLYNGLRTDGSLRTISGLADIKGVCRYEPVWYGASINFDNGLYAATQTAAHEMGHNLGAYHDGNSYYAPSCTGRDQYIMASSPGVLTDANYLNAFTFSPCSIRSIKDYLTSLTVMGTNCLLTRSDWEEVDTTWTEAQKPGQRFDPDEQCRIRYGQRSYYCGGGDRDATICRQMYCYVPSTDRCYVTTEQRAADGTTCGNNMWCDAGNCVFDSNAPSAPDSCIYGDYKGRLYSRYQKYCREVIIDSPFLCYNGGLDECCESCAQIYDESKPGCEFGDHSPYCGDIRPMDCYTEETRRDCCAQCAAFEETLSAGPGCEYGDEATWCASQIKQNNKTTHSRCYAEHGTCCGTCSAIRDDTKLGCEWGDMASWCRSREQRHCDEKRDREVCCDKCVKEHSGDDECPYGDRGRYCQRSECSDRHTWTDCCKTCSKEIAAARTTSAATTTTTTTTTRAPENEQCEDTWPDYCGAQSLSNCYRINFRRGCCQTCRNGRSAVPNCEYGDRNSWCPTYIPGAVRDTGHCRDLSISLQEDCCDTCYKLVTTTLPEPSWCTQNFFIGQCYDPSTERTCHSTCAAHRDGSKDECRYGDRDASCQLSDCYITDRRTSCCQTCHGVDITSSTSSTTRTTPSTTSSTTTTTTTTLPTTTATASTSTTTAPTTAKTTDESCVDKAVYCPGLFPGDCYLATYRKACCRRCAAVHTGIIGCEYGNNSTWCDSYVSDHVRPGADCSVLATDIKTICCDSCNKLLAGSTSSTISSISSSTSKAPLQPTTTTTTAYPTTTMAVDESPDPSWCSTYHPGICYNNQTMQTCRSFCNQHRNSSQPECRYGDRDASCQLSDCYITDRRTLCCQTCHGVDITSSTSSTTRTTPPMTSRTTTTTTTTLPTTTATTPTTTTTAPTTATTIDESCVDKASYCPGLLQGDCYLATYRKACCRRCAAVHTGVVGCEYGNNSTWCESYVSDNVRPGEDCSVLASDIKTICCDSCNKLLAGSTSATISSISSSTSKAPSQPTTTTTTAYPTTTMAVDESPDPSWCTTYHPGICYNNQTMQTCRSFCNQHRNPSQPGCEYGNHRTWCESYVSDNVRPGADCSVLATDIKTICCDSCNKLLAGSTTTTTSSISSSTSKASSQPTTTTTTAYPTSTMAVDESPDPSWCSTSHPGICYNNQTMETCRSYCNQHRIPSKPDCPYGDRFQWCKIEYCDSESENCCDTCRGSQETNRQK